MRWALPMLLLAAAVGAQDRDFLTTNEADQVREAQEPNARLVLYTRFASERIELLKQLLAKPKAGRSLMIHDTLEDYAHLIEAIDTVSDDALKRKVDITEGLKAVAAAEKPFLDALERAKAAQPGDSARFEFVMDQAIDTTRDSIELAASDVRVRAQQVAGREEREKQERQAMTADPEAKSKDDKSAASQTDAPKRKPPTLRRPGEVKPPDK